MAGRGDDRPLGGSQHPADDRLDSWKEIAAYLRRGVSTAQRWERDEGLPTHRLLHSKLGSVYAYKSELDRWMIERRGRIEAEPLDDGPNRTSLDPIAPPLATPATATADAQPKRHLGVRLGVAAGIVAAGALLLRARLGSAPAPEARLEPPRTFLLTSGRGLERHPALSPDGQKLAYVSNEGSPTFDLYVKDVDSPVALRLTTSGESECCPTWAPDQRSLAFLRMVGNEAVLITVPAVGGTEERRATLSRWFGSGLSWSPDGRFLAYSDRAAPQEPFVLKRLDLEAGETKRLTEPSPEFSGDAFPRYSPDGKLVAFARLSASEDVAAADVHVVASAGGEPRRLTRDQRFIGDLDWTADSRAVFYLSNRTFPLRFWKVGLTEGGPTLLFPYGDPFAIDSFAEALVDVSSSFRFSAARSRERLALTLRSYDTNVLRLDPRAPETALPEPLIGSSQVDESPQVSPDGRRIAFTSRRSGYQEIWVCDRDGQACGSLTRTLHGGTPRWSPDSRLIAFDDWPENDDRADVFSIDLATRERRRVSEGTADDVVPSFSRDGQAVYFASNRTGRWQIFKAPLRGGEPRPVTQDGGFAAFESPDGKTVYYTKFNRPGLFAVPAGGGPERQLLDRPRCWGHFAVAPEGLYVLDSRENQETRLERLGFAGGPPRQVATLERRPPCAESSLAASPDGRFLLYVGVDEGSDIVRVDGFR